MIYCKSLHNIDESTLNGTFKGSAVPAYHAFDTIGGGIGPHLNAHAFKRTTMKKEVVNHH